MTKIALFPGCFDPFHKQHQKIGENVLKWFKLDELWILVNKNSQEKKIIAPFKNRFEIIAQLFCENPKIKVWNKPIGFYTTTLVKKLKKQNPKNSFYLILGSDQVNKLDQWKFSKNIHKLIKIICIPRKGHPIRKEIKNNYQFLTPTTSKFNKNNFNSQTIKNGLNWSFLKLKTIQYLIKNELYFKNILKKNISDPQRIIHSYKVANLAISLVKRFGDRKDIPKIKLTALFHDLTKTWNEEKHLHFWKKHKLDLTILKNEPYPVWHAYTSAYYLEKELMIKDKNIFNSIYYHTTANKNFTNFAKIIFIADKLEPQKRNQKNFATAQKMLKKKDVSLNTIFNSTLVAVYQEIKNKGKKPNKDIKLAYQKALSTSC